MDKIFNFLQKQLDKQTELLAIKILSVEKRLLRKLECLDKKLVKLERRKTHVRKVECPQPPKPEPPKIEYELNPVRSSKIRQDAKWPRDDCEKWLTPMSANKIKRCEGWSEEKENSKPKPLEPSYYVKFLENYLKEPKNLNFHIAGNRCFKLTKEGWIPCNKKEFLKDLNNGLWTVFNEVLRDATTQDIVYSEWLPEHKVYEDIYDQNLRLGSPISNSHFSSLIENVYHITKLHYKFFKPNKPVEPEMKENEII